MEYDPLAHINLGGPELIVVNSFSRSEKYTA